MLYLTRKIGESVIINDDIEVTVVDIRGKSIKLGFTFPPEASVLRRELYDRVQAENRAAAAASEALVKAFTGPGAKPGDGPGDGEEPSDTPLPAGGRRSAGGS